MHALVAQYLQGPKTDLVPLPISLHEQGSTLEYLYFRLPAKDNFVVDRGVDEIYTLDLQIFFECMDGWPISTTIYYPHDRLLLCFQALHELQKRILVVPV